MAEHGFYHPSRGYVQTLSYPTPEQFAEYPEGTYEVPIRPGPDHVWDEVGEVWVHNPPPPPPPVVPQVISGFQARELLRRRGQYDAARNAASSLGEGALRAFDEASEWDRDSQSLATLAPILGYTTPESIDALFIEAATIRF